MAIDGEVGARHIADEETVAGEGQPWLIGARVVDHLQGRVLGAVAGRVHRDELDVADLDAIAVVEGGVRVGDARKVRDVDGDPELEGECAVARDVVGVRVRLDDAHELRLVALERAHQRARIERRIHDDRLIDLLAADEIRRTAEVGVDELLKDHAEPFRIPGVYAGGGS